MSHQFAKPHRAQQNQQDKALALSLSKNDTTLVAMTSIEFLDYAVAVKVSQGMSRGDAVDWVDGILTSSTTLLADPKRAWNRNKDALKNLGSYAPVALDTKTLGKLASDLHKGGSVFSKYRVNYHGGKAYVVIAGYPGLRNHLTSTRYLAGNPKVVSMGIGKMGAADAIKGGLKVSVIFTVAFHAFDQLMNDQSTWHDFVAGVTVDVVAAATGGAIAWSVISVIVGGAAMAAVGPIVIVVIAGFLTTMGLIGLTNQYRVADKLATMLREAEKRFFASFNQIDREINRGLSHANEDPIGFMHKLFGVPYLGKIHEY